MSNPAIMKIAQSNLFEMADEAVEQMKVVEGDTKLADLQGFIAGVKDTKELLEKAGFDVVSDADRVYISIDSLGPTDLAKLAQEATTPDPRWNELDRMRQEMEREKKDFLYSEECTKGRDLAYIHAWKRAVHYVERYYTAVITRAEAEQEKGAVLDFGEE